MFTVLQRHVSTHMSHLQARTILVYKVTVLILFLAVHRQPWLRLHLVLLAALWPSLLLMDRITQTRHRMVCGQRV